MGKPIYLSGSEDIVVEINGKRWETIFNDNCNYRPYEPDGKSIVFKETDKPLSISNRTKDNYYFQVFGQPQWIQGPLYPSYKGKPCYHLLTIRNNWGDNGNYNILIGTGDNGDPEIAFFEASCH